MIQGCSSQLHNLHRVYPRLGEQLDLQVRDARCCPDPRCQAPREVVQEGATPPWMDILEVSMATGESGKYELRSEGDSGTDGRLPPPGLNLCLFIEQRVRHYADTSNS